MQHTFNLRELYSQQLNLRVASLTGRRGITRGKAGDPPAHSGYKAGHRGFQVSRRALRILLSMQVQHRIPPEEWILASSTQGKPLVLGPELGFHVSIAYAGSICGVATAQHRLVGIDLEPLPGQFDDDFPIYLLSEPETTLVHDCPTLFLRVWTLKEALAKEQGIGLIGDTDSLDTSSYARSPPGRLIDRPDGGTAFHCHFCIGKHRYALALMQGPLLL
ncbi:4'-phosphopantetheinyl transferase superfamily protein [Halomonas sp. QHL1]|uniref:4'-phosphopantetheinyl transferase family protein n=1 Tax=Halomonas sp. QHL1 TaxID=1123773 RepID=UPI0008FD86BC|nr:4'-phosphopantetheinyl transferase superfamily protein [Halomonas sp. QHL1]OJA04808.1 hypothetical protein QHL1GM_05075 [Halomonas sp. QHL1]